MCEGFMLRGVFLPWIICLIFLHNYTTFMAWTFLFSNAYINANYPLLAREKKKIKFPLQDSNPWPSDFCIWNLTMSLTCNWWIIHEGLTVNCWLIDDHCGLKWFAQQAMDSNCSCFLLEITICSPKDLFYWPQFMDIFRCWMGFSFSLSTEVRRSLSTWTCIICFEGKSSDRVLVKSSDKAHCLQF